MKTFETHGWLQANQRYLKAALNVIGKALDRCAAMPDSESVTPEYDRAAVDALNEIGASLSAPAMTERLAAAFNLSAFERDVLLLCVGMELDAAFADRCAAAQRDAHHRYPTFGLALAALPGAYWSCTSPGAPLRYWRLIELASGDTLASSPLKIDERILHYVTSVQHLDQRLEGFMRFVVSREDLPPTHKTYANRIARLWSDQGKAASMLAVHLRGNDSASLLAIAGAACDQRGLGLYEMSAQDMPLDPRETESLVRLWQREAILTSCALFLNCGQPDAVDSARAHAVGRFLTATGTPLIVGGDVRRYGSYRQVMTIEVAQLTECERRTLWLNALGDAASSLDGDLNALALQHKLDASSIRAVVTEALGRQAPLDGRAADSEGNLRQYLSEACRVRARSRMSLLAQRIEPIARWDDIVLQRTQMATLREIAVHVRQRMKVYEEWGFARKQSRGLGISSLFAGPSGTGKTMAAEVLANELGLDLFRIDLSQVVNKYIGETEKNLRRVFDAAEESGAILLFDEADALFGKRSEVKDSHDRYANIEISYLLQRMEAYHGLAVLTTNMKSAVDDAFRRRIRFIVDFPFPDIAQRAEIWQRIFPDDTPTDGLNIDKLASLSIAGGNINNMAMNAAFLAAEENQPVRMSHLLHAARSEFLKMGKTIGQAEVRGWA